jgi:hypothetical protein
LDSAVKIGMMKENVFVLINEKKTKEKEDEVKEIHFLS